jgi:hypothetical protein
MRKVRNQQESTTSDGTPRAVQIRPARDSDTASACDAVNAIAAEKWYLATVDGFSLEQSRTFMKKVVDGSLPHVLAVVEDHVVGFCSIPLAEIGG